ncbi:conserved hypothetical protein [Candidatus Desulfarcum epimagneticum]|uniref:Glutaredoxin domain-containing protein n=1 Tax=uncultured Desulfobacteraceae bacterium TaxID=218296 RepID=A0A484HFL5_9BACT|nr:conserved hypothetical protein [uncultured Desulfobacteraceae bacterium]
MAKEFLSKKGVDFKAFDVTRDPEALKEMKALSGARTVPVISVCGNVMIGFDAKRLEHDLKCLEQSSPL